MSLKTWSCRLSDRVAISLDVIEIAEATEEMSSFDMKKPSGAEPRWRVASLDPGKPADAREEDSAPEGSWFSWGRGHLLDYSLAEAGAAVNVSPCLVWQIYPRYSFLAPHNLQTLEPGYRA